MLTYYHFSDKTGTTRTPNDTNASIHHLLIFDPAGMAMYYAMFLDASIRQARVQRGLGQRRSIFRVG